MFVIRERKGKHIKHKMDEWMKEETQMHERKKKRQAGSVTGVELGPIGKAGGNEDRKEK